MIIEDHSKTIDRALSGQRVAHDAAVVDSWKRCIERHHLDPIRRVTPQVLPQHRLREHKEQSERLTRRAQDALKTLFHRISPQNYVVLLTDKSGVALEQFANPDVEAALKPAGLMLGANWSENVMGTTGIGATLATAQALNVHQRDHFSFDHLELTCSAAPIFDSTGRLTAVLDISRIHAPRAKESQTFALKLVKAFARRIEMANLEATGADAQVLWFSTLPEQLETSPEAAVSVDAAGQILGGTSTALKFLAQSTAQDWQATGSVIGRNVAEFFDVDRDALCPPIEPRILQLHSGATVFGRMSMPAPARRKAAVPPPASPVQKALGTGDPRIEALADQADRLARTRIPILLQGETGTGKELLARAIHKVHGDGRPFVAINCAGLPADQLDEQLFGTFGRSGHPGLIEAATGGTLFLDEIGDMSLEAQARLLRVLEDGQLRPIGGGASMKTEFRLISATQQDLSQATADGRFRKDLLFRIAAATLDIPPLRERSDTINIAQRILRRVTVARPETWRLTRAASAEIQRRTWPGNLRELRSTLEVATALSDRPEIDAADLPPAILDSNSVPAPRDDLKAVLEACDWNLTRAARRMGVDRSTIHRRMHRSGLKRP